MPAFLDIPSVLPDQTATPARRFARTLSKAEFYPYHCEESVGSTMRPEPVSSFVRMNTFTMVRACSP